jgi:hypothetical protein
MPTSSLWSFSLAHLHLAVDFGLAFKIFLGFNGSDCGASYSLVLKVQIVKCVINSFEQHQSKFDEISASERPLMIKLEIP